MDNQLNPDLVKSQKNINFSAFNKTKWKIIIVVLMILAFVFNIAFGVYLMTSNAKPQIACTMEAKLCPDGSSVGRSGPKCEFSKCPSATPTINSASNLSLEIKELGIKFNIYDFPELKYKYRVNSTGDDVAILYTDELAKYCSPDAPDAPLGVIFKINGQYSAITELPPGELLKQEKTYFVSYRSPQQNCTNDIDGMTLQGKQVKKIKAIIPTLKLIDQKITPSKAPTTTGPSVFGKGCKTGGCSGEICQSADSEPVNSICIYKEEYACYKTARCEIQANGKCGWTQSTQLISCLSQSK